MDRSHQDENESDSQTSSKADAVPDCPDDQAMIHSAVLLCFVISDTTTRPFVVGLQPLQPNGNRPVTDNVLAGDSVAEQKPSVGTVPTAGGASPDTVGRQPVAQGYSPQIRVLENGSQILIRCRTLPEHQGVRVDFRARFSSLNDVNTLDAGPPNTSVQVPRVRAQDVEVSANVPPGQSLAIWGLRKEIVGRDEGSPVVNGIPYVSRMFKSTGDGTMELETLLLVTPRIMNDHPTPSP